MAAILHHRVSAAKSSLLIKKDLSPSHVSLQLQSLLIPRLTLIKHLMYIDTTQHPDWKHMCRPELLEI